MEHLYGHLEQLAQTLEMPDVNITFKLERGNNPAGPARFIYRHGFTLRFDWNRYASNTNRRSRPRFVIWRGYISIQGAPRPGERVHQIRKQAFFGLGPINNELGWYESGWDETVDEMKAAHGRRQFFTSEQLARDAFQVLLELQIGALGTKRTEVPAE